MMSVIQRVKQARVEVGGRITGQIDQHRMLRYFLDIRLEALGQLRIFACIGPTAACPRDWIGIDLIPGNLDQHLRRSPHEFNTTKIKVEHVW